VRPNGPFCTESLPYPYAADYDVNISPKGGVAGSETLQLNLPCGIINYLYGPSVLFQASGAQPSAATTVPAFILYNRNHPQMYADSAGNGGFLIRTSPTFVASNMVAIVGAGYSTFSNIGVYNYSHINMTGASFYDGGSFFGSVRLNVGSIGTGGTSGQPVVAYKIVGVTNDMVYENLNTGCQDSFCTDLVIQKVPQIDMDGEGLGRLTFIGGTAISDSSTTSPNIVIEGINSNGVANAPNAGIGSLLFDNVSIEGTGQNSCVTITDAVAITFDTVNCTTNTYNVGGSTAAFTISSTASANGTYQTSDIVLQNMLVSTNFNSIVQNNISPGTSLSATNNFYPWTGHYQWGNGKHSSVTLSQIPFSSDMSVASPQFIASGTTQGLGAFGVGTGTIMTTALPASYVGVIGPASGTPAYFLQLPSALPTAGQQLVFAAPTTINGLSQAVGTWAIPGTGGTATITVGATAQIGTGGTAVCATSHLCDSYSGEITLTTGTGTLSSGTLVTVTFGGTTRPNPPNCLLTQQGGTTAISAYAKSSTSTVLTISGLAAASGTYVLTYGCGGN
jgi:hypothetical protein